MEVLIVTIMLSVVSLAIYSTFANGIKIWQRVNAVSPDEDLDVFCEKLASDIRNAFLFKEIRFTGKPDTLQLATFVQSARLSNKAPGEVIYAFDQKLEAVSREAKDYSGVYNNERGVSSTPLKGVRSAVFSYYAYDPKEKEYFWQDEWAQEGLPLAVRVALQREGSDTESAVVRTFGIPVSAIDRQEAQQ